MCMIFDNKLMLFVERALILEIGMFFLTISYGVCICDTFACDYLVFA